MRWPGTKTETMRITETELDGIYDAAYQPDATVDELRVARRYTLREFAETSYTPKSSYADRLRKRLEWFNSRLYEMTGLDIYRTSKNG